MVGLLLAVGLTVADPTGRVATAGRWAAAHRGVQAAVWTIFFLSGFGLGRRRLADGVRDVPCILASLFVIFAVSPALASGLARFVGPWGLQLGLILVGIMPTTLSSGVVMTAAAGGNPATALVVTVVANWLAVLWVPWALEWFLGAGPAAVDLDKAALAVRIGLLVAVPLALGMAARRSAGEAAESMAARTRWVNPALVVTVVWMSASRSREALVGAPAAVVQAAALSVAYHGAVLASLWLLVTLLRFGKGRREPLLFMGGQKTLPLAVLIQSTLYPEVGQALIVCVVHHLVHLVMDGYLVTRLAGGGRGEGAGGDV
ncbi:MAG: bile acid:sodium symporter [Deferrisomatales bacterium]